ncbi:MAG TPA: DUF2497 domain-containing protein, partial [Pararhizobium sp.]|nr:DUF2497 domain-containing protein [Pararhizobium sp.]
EEPTDQMAANDAGVAAQAAKAEPRPDDAASKADGEPGLEMSLHEVLAAAVEPASDEAPAMPAAEQEEPSVRPGQMKPGTQLMSPGAGAKVAAAFGDLSDIFNGDPRRSFDEMAEELLRPMLQQWLDDNLPTLVERLVREEIERVARGNRR